MSLVARAANRFGYLSADPTVAIRAQADLWQALLPLYHPGLIPTPPPGASNYPLLPQAPRAETSAYTVARTNLPFILPPVVVPLPPGGSTGYPNPRGVDQGAAQFSITAYSQITPTGQQVRLFSYITSSYITGIVIGSTPPPPISALIITNYDWPVPLGARPNDDGTWLQNFQLQLEIMATPPQTNYDWPDPAIPQFPLDGLTWLQGFQAQLEAQTTPPPTNYDWQNPLLPLAALDEKTWVWSSQTQLIPPPAPTNQVTRAVAITRYNPIDPWAATKAQAEVWYNPNLQSPPTPPPPLNYVLPNPLIAPFPVDGRTVLMGFQPYLLPGITNRVPRALAVTRYNPLDPFVAVLAQDNQQSALPITPPANTPAPFIYDYPNPRGATQPVTNNTWFQGLSPLYAKFTIPFSYDYQNPRAKPQTVTNSTWAQGSPIWLFTKPTPPRANYDQPNPRAPVFVITNRTWANPPPNPTPLRPFPVLLWPNPEQKRYPIENLTVIQTMSLGLKGYTTETLSAYYTAEDGTSIYVVE